MDNPNTCQWQGPTDSTEPSTAYTRYKPTCCASVVPGRSYCEEHLWLVYQKGTAVQRRKDKKRAEAIWDLESEFNRAVEELIEEGFDI